MRRTCSIAEPIRALFGVANWQTRVESGGQVPVAKAITAVILSVGMAFSIAGAVAGDQGILSGSSTVEDRILLYPMPEVSYAQKWEVTGVAWPNQAIALKLNGRIQAETVANDAGDFAIAVPLHPGDNRIQVVAAGDERESFASVVHTIRYTSVPGSVDEFPLRASSKAAPAPPVLDPLPSTTTNNPVTISGTAPGDTTVRFFVNGSYTREIEIDSSGNFSTWLPIYDGLNDVYAIAVDQSGQSPASNTVNTDYTNNLSRDWSGTISANTVWTSGDGTPYTISNDLAIAAGSTLSIQPGVTVEIDGNFELRISGALVARGSSGNPVLTISTAAGCDGTQTKRQDWAGIVVESDATASLHYSEVQCATRGVDFDGGEGDVQHSDFLNNYTGIEISASSPSETNSPQVTATGVHGSLFGISVLQNGNPIVSGDNVITGNQYGVYVAGNENASTNPAPVVTGNSIHSNSTENFRTLLFGNASTVTLNATGNWWNATDVETISDGIYDWTDSRTHSPVVDYSGFLDGPGGDPVYTGRTLNGLMAASEVLSDPEYLLLGDVQIASAAQVTVPSGVHVEAGGKFVIEVEGDLDVQGTSSAPALFRPVTAECDSMSSSRSDWEGIEVLPGGTASILHAEIHCAQDGVYFNGGEGTVQESRVLSGWVGIKTQANSSANAIAPDISSNNEISRCQYGIWVGINSAPQIQNGNVITNNKIGIYAIGNQATSQNPQPVVNGNSLNGNQDWAYRVYDFGSPTSTILDATDNFWGETDPVEIADLIWDWYEHPDSAIVDFYGFLDAPGGQPALAIYQGTLSPSVIEPLDGETADGTFTLNGSQQTTITMEVVRHDDGSVVFQDSQLYSIGRDRALSWDGFDDQGGEAGTGLYRLILTADDGTDQYTYDPPSPSDPGSNGGMVPPTHDPYRNDFYKIQLDVAGESLLSMLVAPNAPGFDSFRPMDDQYSEGGTVWVYWNGRDPSGEIIPGTQSIWHETPTKLAPLMVQVDGTAPVIRGNGAEPNIEVKSDPYLVTHSYEQVSDITYRIDMDSYVTVKLLPPGIYDPDHQDAITIQSQVLQMADDQNGDPIDHVVQWRGFATGTPRSILTPDEGAFTFSIQAESDATGNESQYLGVLNIRR